MAYKIPTLSPPAPGSITAFTMNNLSAASTGTYTLTTISSGTFVPFACMLTFVTGVGTPAQIAVGTSTTPTGIAQASPLFLNPNRSVNMIGVNQAILNITSGQSIIVTVQTAQPQTFNIAVVGYYI